MKKCIFLAGFMGLLLLSAGCSGKKDSGKVSITYINFGGYAANELHGRIIKMFEEKHPDIKVRFILPESGYYEKVMTMSAAGTPPDIMYIEEKSFFDWAKRGTFLKLLPFIEKDKFDVSEYYSNLIDIYKYEDDLYGLPFVFSTVVLYYNKDLFDQAKVSYPDDKWDWQIFLDVARKLTKDTDGDGRIDQFGFVLGGWMNRWAIWVWQNNGKIISDDFSKCMLDMPETIEAMQFYGDLINKYHVSPTVAQMKEQSWDTYFSGGRAAMTIMAYYSVAEYRKAKFAWDIAPLPKGKRRAGCLIGGANCILKETKHPAEAWEFLKFLSSEEALKVTLEMTQGIPALKSLAESPQFLNPGLPPEHIRVFLDELPHSQIATLGPRLSRWGGEMDQTIEDIWAGRRSANAVCEELTKKFDKILSSHENTEK